MSREATVARLSGEGADFVSGLSWIPTETLMALAGDGAACEEDALASVVMAFRSDFAFVPNAVAWAPNAVERLHDVGAAALWAVDGPFGLVAADIGWAEAIALTASRPTEMEAALERSLLAALDRLRAGVAAGADAIVIADDLAGAQGWLVSPDFALDVLVPCYRQLASAAQRFGKASVFHSDGDVRLLMPALKRAGFSAVHAAPFERVQLSALVHSAQAVGLVAIGGVSARWLASDGARRVGVAAGELAAEAGLLVCDDGSITQPEELAAVGGAVEAARAEYSGSRG